MCTIGEVSKKLNIPISTLRYYDKEGLFPRMKRNSGIRVFTDNELEALRVIECLKKSGLEIKDIKQFMSWCQQGSSTYEIRREFFKKQKEKTENEIEKMKRVLSLLEFKCWYYEKAIKDGNEDEINKMLPNKLPKKIQELYDHGHM